MPYHRDVQPNRITKHHLTPKERGGSKKDQTNILRLKYSDHHHPWHVLFGVQTLEETILTLLHLAALPYREDPLEEHFFVAQSEQKTGRRRNSWEKLFGDHSLREVIDRLIRLKRLKCRKSYLRSILTLYDQIFGDKDTHVVHKKKRRERAPHRPSTNQFFARQNCRA